MDLFTKYKQVISKLEVDSKDNLYLLLPDILKLLPEILVDIKDVQNPVEQKTLVVDLVNTGITELYSVVASKLGITQDEWTSKVVNYVKVVVDYEIDRLLTKPPSRFKCWKL